MSEVLETVRCPACRGAKKVPKLGGVIGECNTCKGKGNILLKDKPVPVVAVVDDTNEILNQVADCLPVSEVVPEIEVVKDVKAVESKRVLYKRKKA
jgi:hypothetical protein